MSVIESDKIYALTQDRVGAPQIIKYYNEQPLSLEISKLKTKYI